MQLRCNELLPVTMFFRFCLVGQSEENSLAVKVLKVLVLGKSLQGCLDYLITVRYFKKIPLDGIALYLITVMLVLENSARWLSQHCPVLVVLDNSA